MQKVLIGYLFLWTKNVNQQPTFFKDTLHEISEKLKASAVKDPGEGEQLDTSGSCYKEAVYDLEHLMKSLSNLFLDFSMDKSTDQLSQVKGDFY